MKKIIIILALACMLTSIFAAEAIAVLSGTKGKVMLNRGGKDIKFKSGELLRNKDQLRTGSESFAAYKYVDASSTIKLFSNSVVDIVAVQNGTKMSKKINLKSGSVYAAVKSGSGAFSVQTPTTVASVKGTGFLSKVDNLGNSMFIVNEGEVEVKVLATEEIVYVAKGKTAVVDPGGGVELRESTGDDATALEREEMESAQNTVPKKMIVPVLDKSGNLKHIHISF